METKMKKNGEVMVLDVIGKLDATTSSELEKVVSAIFDDGENKILMNFTELDYISSAGLRVMLMAAKKVKPLKGKIVLTNLQSHIKEVFDIAGFTPLFPIADNVDAGLEMF